jgi:hypothetical protein
MQLTPDEQRQKDATTAALARSQSFADGRRRVVPSKDQTITLGHGMLTFKANEIIDDLYRIALMESYNVDFIELDVNDRAKRPVADEHKGEAVVRTDNVNGLADALEVDRQVVHDALFGKQAQIDRAAGIIHARGEQVKLQRASDATKLGKVAQNFKDYRTMLETRATAFITALAGEEYAEHFIDGLTGDPKIDVGQFAGDLKKLIANGAAAPVEDLGTPPASTEGGDEKQLDPEEFEPGTPPV